MIEQDYGEQIMTKQKKQYSARKASQFNKWRAFFQFLVCKIGYMVRLKLVYRIEVQGLENVPKDNKYIITYKIIMKIMSNILL